MPLCLLVPTDRPDPGLMGVSSGEGLPREEELASRIRAMEVVEQSQVLETILNQLVEHSQVGSLATLRTFCGPDMYRAMGLWGGLCRAHWAAGGLVKPGAHASQFQLPSFCCHPSSYRPRPSLEPLIFLLEVAEVVRKSGPTLPLPARKREVGGLGCSHLWAQPWSVCS